MKITHFFAENTKRFTSIEARPFKVPFYKASHSKGIKERALHVHQRKTKHFIAKLLAQPFMVLQTILKSMTITCF